MYENEKLNRVIRLVEERKLGQAIVELENYLLADPKMHSEMEALVALRNDYGLMLDYWQRGFSDPGRNEQFGKLAHRLYVQATNILMYDRMHHNSYWVGVYLRPRQIRSDWSMTSIRRNLEAFVTDAAMLQLEPEPARREKEESLYGEHHSLMRDLFDYILTSRMWSDSLASAFIDILLTPTIDSLDQQVIVSAITLSIINTFGVSKFKVLLEVYRHTSDEQLRQRALVGWVLALDGRKALVYDEINQMVKDVCSDQTCCDELTELQMQLNYCMEVENDQKKIYNEIMPEIINGSNMKITRQGIVEMEEDSLEDILHPDAAERNMERVEESIGRMVDMQKQGVDIYFGGFSQMKRFPFYNELVNWFVPFYEKHPGISTIWNNTRGKRFLQIITKIGTFCDSDKYSFVLAFEHVVSRIPKNMMKLIEDGEASPMPIGGEIAIEDQRQPAFIRRVYLQNLYRFYKLYPARGEFRSPFDEIGRYVFFSNGLFKDTKLQERMEEVAGFLMKHKRYEEAKAVLDNCSDEQKDYDYYMMMGSLLLRLPLSSQMSASSCFRKALELEPGSERALSGYARASFRFQNYEVAQGAYETLLSKKPDHRGYLLNSAICLTNLGRQEESLKLLYKLDYLYPDDIAVKRVLAWVLTVDGKYEQAGKNFQQLLSIENPDAVDMLNYGYCQWFSGNVAEAIVQFKQFLASQKDEDFNMETELMRTEYSLIKSRHIDDIEIRLMLDSFY